MRNIFAMIVVASLLTGCGASIPVKPDTIVYVDRAVPSCPAPPIVPQFEYKVDKLQPTDTSTPGVVVKDYVYDMEVLRTQVRLYQMILDEYAKAVQDFAKAQAEIDKIQKP